MQGVAVVAVTLAAGLVSLWSTGGNLGGFLKTSVMPAYAPTGVSGSPTCGSNCNTTTPDVAFSWSGGCTGSTVSSYDVVLGNSSGWKLYAQVGGSASSVTLRDSQGNYQSPLADGSTYTPYVKANCADGNDSGFISGPGFTYSMVTLPSIRGFSCSLGNSFTLPMGSSTSCTVVTNHMTSAYSVKIEKSGRDCDIAVAGGEADQSHSMGITAGSPGCFGPWDAGPHNLVANIYQGATFIDGSSNTVFATVPSAVTTCANGACSTAAGTVMCGTPSNQQTPWSQCVQQAALVCQQPTGACNASQYCDDAGTTSSTVCQTISFTHSISSGMGVDFNARTAVAAFNVGAINQNPYNYKRCVLWNAYEGDGSETGTPFASGAMQDGNFTSSSVAIPNGATKVTIWGKGFWVTSDTVCDATTLKAAPTNNNFNGATGWIQRSFTGTGGSATIEVPSACGGELKDGTIIPVSVTNDPTAQVDRVEAWIDGRIVGWGVRSQSTPITGGVSIPVRMYFAQQDFPLATGNPNWKFLVFRTLSDNGGTISVLEQQAAACTGNVQHTFAGDVLVNTPIGSGACSSDVADPTIVAANTTLNVSTVVDTGDPAMTSIVKGVQVRYGDGSKVGNTYIGRSEAGTTSSNQFTKAYTVPVSIPGAATDVRSFIFEAYDTSNNFLRSRTCFVRIQAAAATLSAANSTVTVGASACVNNAAQATVTVTAKDSAGAVVSGATIELISLKTGLSIVSKAPTTGVSGADGIVRFILTGAAGTYTDPFDVRITKDTDSITKAKTDAGIPDVVLGACGGGGGGCTQGVDACGTCGGTVTTITCNATAPACGQTSTGTNSCGAACALTGDACPVCPAQPTATITPAAASIASGATQAFTVTTTGTASWTVTATGGTVSPAANTSTNAVATNVPVTYTAPATGGSYTVTLRGTPANTVCNAPTAVATVTVTTPAPVCQGAVPANATLCTGDDTGLTANTNRTTVAQCTTPIKCEYVCQTGFTLNGGACVPIVTPSITLTAVPTTQVADGVSTAILTAQLINYPAQSGKAATDISGYTITFTKSTGSTATIIGVVDCATPTATPSNSPTGLSNAAGRLCAIVRAPSAENTSVFTATEQSRNLSDSESIVYTPRVAPADLRVTLLLPLEGRKTIITGDQPSTMTHRTTTLGLALRVINDPSEITKDLVTLVNQTTTTEGLFETTLTGVSLADRRKVRISMKTSQHGSRVVVGTVRNNVLHVNLGNPTTFTEDAGNEQKGKYFMIAGDIEGISAAYPAAYHDDTVEALDVAKWVSAFKAQLTGTRNDTTSPLMDLADLDGNGKVGAEDLSLIIRNFGAKGDAATGGELTLTGVPVIEPELPNPGQPENPGQSGYSMTLTTNCMHVDDSYKQTVTFLGAGGEPLQNASYVIAKPDIKDVRLSGPLTGTASKVQIEFNTYGEVPVGDYTLRATVTPQGGEPRTVSAPFRLSTQCFSPTNSTIALSKSCAAVGEDVTVTITSRDLNNNVSHGVPVRAVAVLESNSVYESLAFTPKGSLSWWSDDVRTDVNGVATVKVKSQRGGEVRLRADSSMGDETADPVRLTFGTCS